MIKVALVDDNCFLLKSTQEKLSFFSDLDIKIIAYDGKEIIEKLENNHNIDIILMDIEMPIMNGIDATSIKVDFRKEQNYISIKIKDNGVGFDAKNVILGNGIFNMKKRINEVHGKLQIVSEPQTGTTVLIQIPNK